MKNKAIDDITPDMPVPATMLRMRVTGFDCKIVSNDFVERLCERERNRLTMENVQVEITLHFRYRSI